MQQIDWSDIAEPGHVEALQAWSDYIDSFTGRRVCDIAEELPGKYAAWCKEHGFKPMPAEIAMHILVQKFILQAGIQ